MTLKPLRFQAGFSLLELVVAMVIIGVFWAILLQRLAYYQEVAEKARMEYTASILKLGLQVRIGHLMALNKVADYAQIARENPVTWLDSAIPDYRGEFTDPQPELPAGSWYFDQSRSELVYLANLHRHLRSGREGTTQVRWYVKTVLPDGIAAKDATVLGLQLVPVEPYRWF